MQELVNSDVIIILIAGFILGLSKAGLKGLGIIVVTLLALIFTAKESTGILMPMLISADILAIVVYRRDVQWKELYKLLPWMVVGILIAVYVGDAISEDSFRKIMAVTIIFSAFMMVAWERMKNLKVPEGLWFSGAMGLGAGFTTMIGNLAGAFSNLYFLAMRFPKNEFIGTAAWLFFIINLFKLPFHIFSWGTIGTSTLPISGIALPGILTGFWVGLKVVRKFSTKQFHYYIIAVTLIGAVIMLIR